MAWQACDPIPSLEVVILSHFRALRDGRLAFLSFSVDHPACPPGGGAGRSVRIEAGDDGSESSGADNGIEGGTPRVRSTVQHALYLLSPTNGGRGCDARLVCGADYGGRLPGLLVKQLLRQEAMTLYDVASLLAEYRGSVVEEGAPPPPPMTNSTEWGRASYQTRIKLRLAEALAELEATQGWVPFTAGIETKEEGGAAPGAVHVRSTVELDSSPAVMGTFLAEQWARGRRQADGDDPNCRVAVRLKQIDSQTAIMYRLYRPGGSLLAPLELVTLDHHLSLPDGRLCILSFSVEHVDAPHRAGAVRSHLHLSLRVLRSAESGGSASRSGGGNGSGGSGSGGDSTSDSGGECDGAPHGAGPEGSGGTARMVLQKVWVLHSDRRLPRFLRNSFVWSAGKLHCGGGGSVAVRDGDCGDYGSDGNYGSDGDGGGDSDGGGGGDCGGDGSGDDCGDGGGAGSDESAAAAEAAAASANNEWSSLPDEYGRALAATAEEGAALLSSEDGWGKAARHGGMTSEAKDVGDMVVIRTRARMEFPPLMLADVQLMAQSSGRSLDAAIERTRVVDMVGCNAWVLHHLYKPMAGAAPRDFLVLAHWGILPCGSLRVVTRAVEHPGCPPDPTGAVVRASDALQYMLVTPARGGRASDVALVSGVVLGGHTRPAAVKRKLLSRPPKMLAALRRFVKRQVDRGELKVTTYLPGVGSSDVGGGNDSGGGGGAIDDCAGSWLLPAAHSTVVDAGAASRYCAPAPPKAASTVRESGVELLSEGKLSPACLRQ